MFQLHILLDTWFMPDTGTGALIEILIMLAVAFILGYLIRRSVFKSKLEQLAALERENADLKATVSDLRGKLADCEGKAVASTDFSGRIRDLEGLNANLRTKVADLEARLNADNGMGALKAENADLKARLAALEAKNAELTAAAAAAAAAGTASAGTGLGVADIPVVVPPKSERDDLKKVEGIGPKIESILNEAGIWTWEKLAGTDPSRIKEILLAVDQRRYRIHDPSTWPKQSALCAAGKWDELSDLQDRLKAGRER
ncbi:MAG: hypothetical protein AAF206_30015 [Bacteroidota bacterium]